MGFLSSALSLGGALTGITALSSAGSILSANDTNRQNRENAQDQMDFQERMSGTAHQREVKDLIAAGLNPMLSARLGGASTPSGAMATAQNPAEASARTMVGNTQSALNTTQVQNVMASTAKLEAEKQLVEAQTDLTKGQSTVIPVTISQMQQNINESQERIQKIIQEVKTGGASEANIRQQTTNLEATLPQIKATIDQLRAQTQLTGAQTGLTQAHSAQSAAQTGLIGAQTGLTGQMTAQQKQVIAANLPKAEAAIKELERQTQVMKMPGRMHEASVQDSWAGALKAAMDAINPLKGFIQ